MSNNRSKRQMEDLLRVRDWHLNSALRVQVEDREQQARFHMNHYRLLGPAVQCGETDKSVSDREAFSTSTAY